MTIVYANDSRKNGRWSTDAGGTLCMTLDTGRPDCKTVAKVVPNLGNSSRRRYYLWKDAKSGQVTSHIYEARPGKFIDQTNAIGLEQGAPRPAAGLQEGRLELCQPAGLAAAPHLRSPQPGEKRPRLSTLARGDGQLLVPLQNTSLSDLWADVRLFEPNASASPASPARARLKAFEDARDKRDYEAMLRLLGPVDKVMTEARAKAFAPLSNEGYARYVSGMAGLHAHLGYLNEAISLYCVALNLYAGSPGHRHRDVARALEDAASVLIEQGRDAEAEEMLRRLRWTLDETPGTDDADHRARGDAYLNLLDIYAKQGRFKEVEETLTRARAAATKTFNPASALARAYRIFADRGRYSDAERLARELVRTGSPPHLLASVYVSQGRYDEAREIYAGMWNTLARRPADEHDGFMYCTVGVELAHLRIRKREPTEALAILTDAAKVARSAACQSQVAATRGLAQLELGQAGLAELPGSATGCPRIVRRWAGYGHASRRPGLLLPQDAKIRSGARALGAGT